MAQPLPEPAKIPGLPKPKQERHRRRPKATAQAEKVRQPDAQPRPKLVWSRSIIDQNCVAAPAAPAEIPNVRSTAAMRARAGMATNSQSPIALDPLLASAPHPVARPNFARDIFRPAPGLVPGPEPSLGQRLLHWITGILH